MILEVAHKRQQLQVTRSVEICRRILANKVAKELRQMSDRLGTAMEYINYHQVEVPWQYVEQVSKPIASLTSSIEFQIMAQLLDFMGLISIIRLLYAFRVACDSNGIHERAAMWLFLNSTKTSSASPRLHYGRYKKTGHIIASKKMY